MLTLISATPGSGKTLKAVELIYECLNNGYVVYSNILGLKVPGVIQISSQEDWRDLDHFRRQNIEMLKTPIAVFYDEAHEHPAFAEKDLLKNYQIDRSDYDLDIDIVNLDDSLTATQKKQRIDEINRKYKTALDIKKEQIREIGTALSMHRHFGFDIFLITQSPKKLAPHILADVGTHLHLRRVFKMKRATIYEFPEAHTTVSKAVRDDAINKTIWKFPKHLYGTYTSTEVDTHKQKIPLKYIIILVLVFIGIPSYVARSLWYDPLFGHKEKPVMVQKSQEIEETKQPQTTIQEMHKPILNNKNDDLQLENQRIAIIVESSTDCYAKNSYGDFIDISVDECKKLSSKNNRMSFSKLKKEQYLQDNMSVNNNDNVGYTQPVYPSETTL
ncbi:zonular occludens toxin domain-containing protein [Acinetobacter baumannii]|uniref:zonular occludens toxin domain-containing protein n=1 Tax=Acinetobacter baumannii TaxID=470 RepID=UPI000CE4AB5E|nr:zonular occludens toxin domain-containing protein [Acinetobacter baumannii]MDC5073450.1 zonular occludens toxin domain-containing protein [Acinetobacter baumannii]MDC5073463.1 zonular occludens toxin domain-containing protein [Acinetobacter baumannii]MDP7844239.1 zonular occludens toxin domain-containing protein [Acinetobacter baumannii]MDP7865730.1 zonular occludens toxin domain-containing protein [Acinetobacter baumannii]PPC32581.1 zonular occludens toxin [Acinetobacter baumannii]